MTMYDWDKGIDHSVRAELDWLNHDGADGEFDVSATITEIEALLQADNFAAAYTVLDQKAQLSILPGRLARLHMEMERYRQMEMQWWGLTAKPEARLKAILAELDLCAAQTNDPLFQQWLVTQKDYWQNSTASKTKRQKDNFDALNLASPLQLVKSKQAIVRGRGFIENLVKEAQAAEHRKAWLEAAVHYGDVLVALDDSTELATYRQKLVACYLNGVDDALLSDVFFWGDISTVLQLLFQDNVLIEVAEELLHTWLEVAHHEQAHNLHQYYYLLIANFLSCKLGKHDTALAEDLIIAAFYNVADCDPIQLEDFCKLHLQKEVLLDYRNLLPEVCLKLSEELWKNKNHKASIRILEMGLNFAEASELYNTLLALYLDRLDKRTSMLFSEAFGEAFELLNGAKKYGLLAESPQTRLFSAAVETLAHYAKKIQPKISKQGATQNTNRPKNLPEPKIGSQKLPVSKAKPEHNPKETRAKRVYINVDPTQQSPTSISFSGEEPSHERMIQHLENLEVLLFRVQWDVKEEYDNLQELIRMLNSFDRPSPETHGRLLAALKGAISLVQQPSKGQRIDYKRLEYYEELLAYFEQFS